MSSADQNKHAHSRSMWMVTSGIFLSRILGFVRDLVFAQVWGTGVAMAAFTTAFTFPNLLRSVFGEGTFSSAFVPVFSDILEKEGQEKAWNAACKVVSVLVAALCIVVIITVPISLVLQHMFHKEPAASTFALLPWLMPYALLICAGGALGMVLNSMGHFKVPALTPLILNLLLVVAALVPFFAYGHQSPTVFVVIPAVLGAGILHVFIHLVVLRRMGLRFHYRPDWRAPEVMRVAKLMAPAVFGSSVGQINIAVDRLLALALGPAAAASLYFSQRLIYLPVGLFGVASSTVSLPALSRAWSRGDKQEMESNLQHSFAQTFFLTIPFVAAMWVAGEPVIRLLFERGSFDASSTRETLLPLLFYLPGIPAFACIKIVASGFYAAQAPRHPVRVAFACVILNLVLNLALMFPLRQGGMALATTLSAIVNLTWLLHGLRAQMGINVWVPLEKRLLRMLMAGALAAGVTYLLQKGLLPPWSRHTPLWWKLADVGVQLGCAYGVFILAALALRCEEAHETWLLLRQKVLSRLRR